MKFSLPQNVNSIISIINKSGFSAHVVGGCIRDILTSRIPTDWDITTNAPPDAVKALFQRTYDTGLKHGTVTVSYGGSLVEVTTWRTETHYSDHRRPDRVDFTESLFEDLARRDFTMNAMAYHPKEGFIDPFGGLDDISRGLIRCVGDPVRRFSEDALRMLRAVRFSAQLGFTIEEKTFAAIQMLSGDIAFVSMERIQIEVNKILKSPAPQKLVLLWQTGLNKVIFPDITALSQKWCDSAVHFGELEEAKVVLLTLLFYTHFEKDTIGQAQRILKGLKYDGVTLDMVSQLLQSLNNFSAYSQRNVRRLVTEYGESLARKTLSILDSLRIAPEYDRDEGVYPAPIKLNISGLDLKNAGLCDRKEIGIMLSALTLCLYEKPELNDFDILMSLARSMNSKIKNSDLTM